VAGRNTVHPRLLHNRHGGYARALLNLVVPLAKLPATAMRTKETSSKSAQVLRNLVADANRQPDVDSTTGHSIQPTTPTYRTLATATRTTTTRTMNTMFEPSADLFTQPHADFLFTDLVQAYFDCRHSKRTSHTALSFELDLERNLSALHRELVDGSYRPEPSICFVITHPKPREVWAAAFRDRIVHHLMYNHVAAAAHARFIADSCACIPGRGTLYAAERLESKIRSITQNWQKKAYYLKCDIANFFISINKNILGNLLASHIKEPHWLALANQILFHDPRPTVHMRCNPAMLDRVPAHKRLTNQKASHGLPIGNLSSQFFANIYMDVLDQFIKHELKCRHYIRYVDDFVVLHESPQQLNQWLEQITAFLPAQLDIQLNPTKTILQPIDRGVDFVGQVIKPWRRTTRRRTVKHAITRVLASDQHQVQKTANSYYGLFRMATHSHIDRVNLTHAVFTHGKAVNWQLTKTYKSPA